MGSFMGSMGEAVSLITALDADLLEIIGLSLRVTLSAVAAACVIVSHFSVVAPSGFRGGLWWGSCSTP